MELTEEQKEIFKKAWLYVYGNGGHKSTMLNHKLLQGFAQYEEDRREPYRKAESNMRERYTESEFDRLKNQLPTQECFQFCDLVLEGKFDEAKKLAKS